VYAIEAVANDQDMSLTKMREAMIKDSEARAMARKIIDRL